MTKPLSTKDDADTRQAPLGGEGRAGASVGVAPVPVLVADFQAMEPERLLGLMEEPLLAFDAAGRVVGGNEAGAALTERSLEGVLGLDCLRVLPPGEGCDGDRPCPVHEALREGRACRRRVVRTGGDVEVAAELRLGRDEAAVLYRERPAAERDGLEVELDRARAEVAELRRRALEQSALSQALLLQAASLRSAADPTEAAERALSMLRTVPELGLAAVGLPEGTHSSSLVRGFARRAGGRTVSLDGRAILLDLLHLSPLRRRVSESFVLEGFRASVQGGDAERAAGDWDLSTVFDGAATALTPLHAEGEAHGFLLSKAEGGAELDETLLHAVELVARGLASALEGLRRRELERRRGAWNVRMTRLGRRLLKVREPHGVLERACEALREEWPQALVEWTQLVGRTETSRPAMPALGLPRLLAGATSGQSSELAPVGAQLTIPIRTAAGLRALITAVAPGPECFDSLDPEGLESFAKIVASAHANAELFRRESLSLRALGLVARVGRIAGSSLDSQELLAPALHELSKHGSFETIAVTQLDRVRGKLILQAQVSRTGIRLQEGLATPADRGLVGRVVRTAESCLRSGAPEPPASRWTDASTRSELCVPLRVLDRVVGVLQVQSREDHAFGEDDLVVAEAVADHLARALHNARLHAAVKTANRELRASERRKTAFLASVAHDLRTPLTSIRSAAEVVLMYEDSSGQESREFLEAIRDESARLGRLVEDFLAHARIEGGELDFDLVEFRLDELLRHFTRLFEGPATRRGLRLDCRIDEDLPGVFGDPERISQVVANLLSNATKFTPEGGSILLSACPLPAEAGQVLGKVLVEVSDTGPGIQETDRDKIFERFFRIDRDPRGPKGAGLGLPIARSLVEHQGGRLWCDGGRGEGAVFRFTLPAFLD